MPAQLDQMHVDQGGSLLRPGRGEGAVSPHERGGGGDGGLQQGVDDALPEVVQLQEQHGLPIVTDGEFRRTGFQESMANAIAGFASVNRSEDLEQRYGEAQPLQRWEQHLEQAGPAISKRRPVSAKLRLERN